MGLKDTTGGAEGTFTQPERDAAPTKVAVRKLRRENVREDSSIEDMAQDLGRERASDAGGHKWSANTRITGEFMGVQIQPCRLGSKLETRL